MKRSISPNIVDIEASGFGPNSYPLEVGVVLGNGERYCSLIKPEDDWIHWSKDAEAIHGISRSTIEQRGRKAKEVCQELNAFLGSSHVFSDAWSHDQHWLQTLFASAKISPRFKLRAIEHILKEEQLNIWDATKKAVARRLGTRRHRASSDALLIQQTFIDSRAASTIQEYARLNSL